MQFNNDKDKLTEELITDKDIGLTLVAQAGRYTDGSFHMRAHYSSNLVGFWPVAPGRKWQAQQIGVGMRTVKIQDIGPTRFILCGNGPSQKTVVFTQNAEDNEGT